MPKPAQQKREIVLEAEHSNADAFVVQARAAGGMCDAGVYCVDETYVSDAPASWEWAAVPLQSGQTCLEDNVFNSEWVEEQCGCAGLL